MGTYMTMSTVRMTTLSTPPPKTGSEMMGKVSLTTMLAKRREISEEKVSILANRDDLLDVLALLSVSRTGQVSAQDKCVRALTAYR